MSVKENISIYGCGRALRTAKGPSRAENELLLLLSPGDTPAGMAFPPGLWGNPSSFIVARPNRATVAFALIKMRAILDNIFQLSGKFDLGTQAPLLLNVPLKVL